MTQTLPPMIWVECRCANCQLFGMMERPESRSLANSRDAQISEPAATPSVDLAWESKYAC